MSWLKTTREGHLISLVIKPRAKRDRIVGVHDNALKVEVKAPPVDGKANAYLLKFLSDVLGVARANLVIRTGQTGRAKQIEVAGCEANVIRDRLSPGR